MIPDIEQIKQLLHKYAPNNTEYEKVLIHGQIVAEIALECAKRVDDDVDLELLEAAAIIHDIGSYPFLAAKYYSTDYDLIYSQHAILGAKILHDEGVNINICNTIETHVGLGLTSKEIEETKRPLPYKNYEPKSIEGRILCYADRFHTKKPKFNTLDSYIEHLNTLNLPNQIIKMKNWSKEFGIPDIDALAKKYNHPVV